MKIDDRPYPRSFDPKALWNSDEICGYLMISKATYYEIEHQIPTFKAGRARVAFAENVIAYAKRLLEEQNPYSKVLSLRKA